MSTHQKVLRFRFFKKDSPRAIDRVIDYFGSALLGRVIDLGRTRRSRPARLRLAPASR
jgi:hypothetical protein